MEKITIKLVTDVKYPSSWKLLLQHLLLRITTCSVTAWQHCAVIRIQPFKILKFRKPFTIAHTLMVLARSEERLALEVIKIPFKITYLVNI